ncbi:MAG: rhodanese [Methylomonas sp.]|nr:MAG: rhodanese [Methylomonas sp.]PPD25496.1 MAG: rhodanese [Methylomonas sp.]PPD36292.1 MAG: rhodanese [Methylomonas sp.]PPD42417.1 MAG: rhodanese [Methylomonas sp.]PPD53127.1 MAG: rhodanese [Methylomonas sp.]
MPIIQLSTQELRQRLENPGQLLLLDVREAHEYAYARIEGSVHVPLRQLVERLDEFNPQQAIAVLCHHGVRSQQACVFMAQQGYDDLYNVRGGIDAWSLFCDPSVPRY